MDWDEFIDWNDLYSKVILRKLIYHKKVIVEIIIFSIKLIIIINYYYNYQYRRNHQVL